MHASLFREIMDMKKWCMAALALLLCLMAGALAEGQEIARLEERALAGDAQAQFDLGKCYASGSGVEADAAAAVYWYAQAAGQGHADAQNNLGICLYNGDGTEQNRQAAAW